MTTDRHEIEASLLAGEIVALPTDTVYGLVGRAEDAKAFEKLFVLKARDRSKAIAILVDGIEQARELVEDPDGLVAATASAFWPGPITVVGRRTTRAPSHLGDERGTLGVRCPASTLIRALAARCGPLAASSANVAGASTLTDASGVAAAFGDSVALVVDGGELPASASTVIDVSVEPWRILREGPIGEDAVRRALSAER